jgi:hypothetical protein
MSREYLQAVLSPLRYRWSRNKLPFLYGYYQSRSQGEEAPTFPGAVPGKPQKWKICILC